MGTLMVFDVDCEEAHRTKQPAPDTWFDDEMNKVARLEEQLPGAFVARSKGGYRVVYRLAPEFRIRNDADKAAWTTYYRRCCAFLVRAFGIVADPACADWTRLYRAPHATRDGGSTPERRDVIGDPARIGAWTYTPADETLEADIETATEVARTNRAWKERVLGPLLRQKRELEGEPSPKKVTHKKNASTNPTSVGSAVTTDEKTRAAAKWLANHPAAIEGDGGDATTYRAALGLVKGFELTQAAALELLLREYNPRCVPPWSEAALKHKVACALRAPGPAGYLLESVDKTVIQVTTVEHDVVDQAQAALGARGGLYQRGGVLVHVVRADVNAPTKDALVRPPSAPRIVPVTLPRLREEVTRVAVLKQPNPKGHLVNVHVPRWLPEQLDARAQWRAVRHLEAVVDAPVLRPDGTVLQEPGYDEATSILFEPTSVYLPVADLLTQADALTARDVLLEVVEDFPFAGPAHRSAALAALLTPFAMFAYAGPAPLVAIDAPAAGTGKSLLADTISVLATGRVMPRMPQASCEDEERKRITSIVLSAERLVLLDNLTRPLGSGPLDAALTGEIWSDRLLGVTKTITMPMHIMWMSSGNNTQVVGDTARRILNIRLDPKMEHPEQRSGFKHPRLLAWIRYERPRLVQAALTILRAFFVAGAPAQNMNGWGSFEGWSSVVRGAVMFVGLPDPADTRNELRSRADSTASAYATVVTRLEALCGGGRLEAGEIVTRLYNKMATFNDLHDALLELRPLPKGQRLDGQQLGYALRKFRERVVGTRRVASEKRGDRLLWFVEDLAPAGAAPPPSPASVANVSTATMN